MIGLFLVLGCTVRAEQRTMDKPVISTHSINTLSKVRMQTSTTEKLEALSAISYDGEKFLAKAISHGCTRSTDFIVQHEILEKQCRVAIIRSKPDMCRRAPMLVEISVQWAIPAECVDLKLVLANPVLVTSSQGAITKRVK